MRFQTQRGVALVITLIMLAMITVLALAFLAVTRQERHSVEHSGYYTDTEQMTISAMRRAQAELVAFMLSTSNTLGPGFLVSVNLDGNGVELTPNVIGNVLQYDPRVPVFVNTNRGGALSNEFRFYMDLNRNGVFDETGWQAETDNAGFLVTTNDAFGNPVGVTNYFDGDPQFLGILADPELAHSRTNFFLGRVAYIVVPIGQTLDLNTVHNDAKSVIGGSSPAFHRGQGVGPWEINLAAFLADLNTNVWGAYGYNPARYDSPADSLPAFLGASGGTAFFDAADLLNFRYADDLNKIPAARQMSTARQLFDPSARVKFATDQIDEYATGLWGGGIENDDIDQPWPGADSLQHFYSLHDLWSVNAQPGYPTFINRLRYASETNSTYDRHTFYRLLSQLGTDSQPEEEGPLGPKVHLNYDNFISSTTNLVEWLPLDQFAVTADRLLRDETGMSVTNIPVFTNMSARATNGVPLYSGRVHQLIQLAANIGDATRPSTVNRATPAANAVGEVNQLPMVYKPIFEQRGTDVFITRYEELDGPTFRTDLLGGKYVWHDLDNPNDRPDGTGTVFDQYYGVPMIVAARKGHPNFNECALQTVVQVTRKLELRKTGPRERPNEVNQMFILGISNNFAVEAWNSYSNAYPRGVQMLMIHQMASVLTNDQPNFRHTRVAAMNNFGGGMSNVVAAGAWAGQEFRIPALNQIVNLSNSVYYQTPTPRFVPAGPTNIFERGVASYTNRWGLAITNRLQFFMFERSTGNLIDCVTIGDLNTFLDISDQLNDVGTGSGIGGVWDPRPYDDTQYGMISRGVLNQLDVSAGFADAGAEWTEYGVDNPGFNLKDSAIQNFRRFLNPPADTPNNAPLVARAPFSPSKRLSQVVSWQVDDPLVHYRSEDLRDMTNNVRVSEHKLTDSISLTNQYNIGEMNQRYRPWAKELYYGSGGGDPNDMNPAVKDPGMMSSDHWRFPTNKLASLGDLGRVHRGTAWQTVYMKSGRVSLNGWRSHVGAGFLAVTDPVLVDEVRLLTAPTNDWRLFDHFTTIPHPNAERGKLSVNQEGMAAWSAVLSGVPIRRMTPVGMTNTVIEPVATGDSAVHEIVEGINRERAQHSLGRFERVGDVLASAELTDASPYIQGANLANLTEEEYEQVPRRIFSLLNVGSSRYAIYAFGQSLRPARDSIILSGANRGLCTNYQITGESAVRAIVRVDFDPITLDPDDPDYNKPDLSKPRAVIESFNLVPIE